MPSALELERTPAQHDGLENYDVDFSDDDPFASPPPEESKKRKEPDNGLGIDEEVSVQKRQRVPNVKLDEDRLLGPAGIPKLRKRAGGLKLKGKGHEFSDASRLLSFYQLWLDDLFPKARFLDALAMVEKAGHKKRLMTARTDWINEGRPNTTRADDEEGGLLEETQLGEAATTSTSQVDAGAAPTNSQRPQTPDRDVPDDDDLYDATPRLAIRSANPPSAPRDDAPDDDDLAALMAEAERADTQTNSRPPAPSRDADPEDDLDALMAESEAQDGLRGAAPGKSKGLGADDKAMDFADEEEAMQEMEGLW